MKTEVPVQINSIVRRITASNSSIFTGPGTNTYLIGNNDVSIMVESSHHGKGVGTNAIKLVEIEAKKLGVSYLVGKMMIFNKKSEKIFVNNGFELKMYWYEKQLSSQNKI